MATKSICTLLLVAGDWLATDGESIYKTRGGPFASAARGGAAYRGNRIYVHLVEWAENTVTLPAISQKIVATRSLTGRSATVQQTAGGIRISVPPEDRQAPDSIILLERDTPAGR